LLSHQEGFLVEQAQSITTEQTYHEAVDDGWDSELFDIVAANADVIVRAPWMGGAETALSPAMWHIQITRENIHEVTALVHEALANRVIEKDELEEKEDPEEETVKEDEPNDETVIKTDAPEEKITSLDTTEADKQPEKAFNQPKHQELPDKKPEASPRPQSSNPIAQESGEAVKSPAVAEAAAPSFTGKKDTGELQATQNETKVIVKSETETETETESESEKEAGQPISNTARAEAGAPVSPRETKPDLKQPPLTIAKEVEALIVSATAEGAAELKDQTYQTAEGAEDEPLIPPIDNQTDPDEIAVIEEAESELDNPYTFSNIWAPELDPAEAEAEAEAEAAEEVFNYQESDEDEIYLPAQLEAQDYEEPVQDSLIIDEIEAPLIQLAESIRASQPEAREEVDEILDKIIELPARLETQASQSNITETEIQEELEELFTELFNTTGIDCTPELTESLSLLTLKLHITEEIKKLKDEEVDGTPQDSDTHEIIKKLLTGLSTFKKAIAQAGAIGKSALQLYSFDSGRELINT
jgi:hypothetical protein